MEINTFFGEIVLHYMKCPQVSAPVKVEMKLISKDVDNNKIKDIIVNNFINLQKKSDLIFDYYNKFIQIIF